MRQPPQRLARTSPPGMLLKRLSGAHARLQLDRIVGSDPAYLAMVRQLPCLKCGLEPAGEAAHVRLTSAAFHKHGGMGRKPADKWALPLDRGCHQIDSDALHRIGEYLFWHQLGINPLLVCERLYAKRGDIVAMRAVILNTISERSR